VTAVCRLQSDWRRLTAGDAFRPRAVFGNKDRSEQKECASERTHKARYVQRRLHAGVLHQAAAGLPAAVPALQGVRYLHHTHTHTCKGGNVTSAGWQVTLCDSMWHVSSRSGVATLRTAIHLLLTYLHIRLTAIFFRGYLDEPVPER